MKEKRNHPLTLIRTARGLTKNKLAVLSGENSGYINLVERYKRPLSVASAMKFADVLKVDGKELHYDSLVTYTIKRAFVEYKDIQKLTKDQILSSVMKVCAMKHAYLIEEYEEDKKLRDAAKEA